MIKAVLYYEVHCDESGCTTRPDDDYSGWSTEDAAEETAHEADWSTDGEGKHWCPTHWPTCSVGDHVREHPDDRCRRCRQWPEDDDDDVVKDDEP